VRWIIKRGFFFSFGLYGLGLQVFQNPELTAEDMEVIYRHSLGNL
jgi:hypothetical protein